jgi:hypothetical protein
MVFQGMEAGIVNKARNAGTAVTIIGVMLQSAGFDDPWWSLGMD